MPRYRAEREQPRVAGASYNIGTGLSRFRRREVVAEQPSNEVPERLEALISKPRSLSRRDTSLHTPVSPQRSRKFDNIAFLRRITPRVLAEFESIFTEKAETLN